MTGLIPAGLVFWLRLCRRKGLAEHSPHSVNHVGVQLAGPLRQLGDRFRTIDRDPPDFETRIRPPFVSVSITVIPPGPIAM